MIVCVAACDFCAGLFPVEQMGTYFRVHAPPGERIRVTYHVCRGCFEAAQPKVAAEYFASDAHREQKKKVSRLRNDLEALIDRKVKEAVADALAVRKAKLVDDAVPLAVADAPSPPPGYRRG